jgi:hypothetical protein
VFETFLIVLEGFVVPEVYVLHFAQIKVEITAEELNVRSKCGQIAPLGSILVFEQLYARQTQLSAQIIGFLEKVVLTEVLERDRVPWVCTESSFKEINCCLTHLKVVDI